MIQLLHEKNKIFLQINLMNFSIYGQCNKKVYIDIVLTSLQLLKKLGFSLFFFLLFRKESDILWRWYKTKINIFFTHQVPFWTCQLLYHCLTHWCYHLKTVIKTTLILFGLDFTYCASHAICNGLVFTWCSKYLLSFLFV